MDCNFGIKAEEDCLSFTKIKTEPQDTKSEIKTEAEGHDIKEETFPIWDLDASTRTQLEIEKKKCLNKFFEDVTSSVGVACDNHLVEEKCDMCLSNHTGKNSAQSNPMLFSKSAGTSFTMNYNTAIKHEEDSLSIAEIKSEQDIKSEIKTETEEHIDIKSFDIPLHFVSIKTTSEMDGTQDILRRLLEGSERKKCYTEEDARNLVITSVREPCDVYIENSEQEKSSVDACNHTRIVNTCSVCNSKPSMCTKTLNKRYKCNMCSGTFCKKSNFRSHFKSVHKGEKPFACNFCSRTFSKKSNLCLHSRIHSSEKPFTCEICSKSFSQKSTLTTHSRIHTNEKPYTCDICSKSFTQKSILLHHARSHANDKPFICNLCTKSFAWKSSLTRHTHIHTS